MKKKSKFGKEVYFDTWKTPISKIRHVWLNAVLQTEDNINFFFDCELSRSNSIVVLTIDRYSPYRVTEEQYAVSCIPQFFEPQKSAKKRRRLGRTRKLWGTPYIHELDQGGALSNYDKKPNKNIVHYLVVTDEEWVEFILKRPPVWKTFKNIKTEKLVRQYARGQILDNKRTIQQG